MKNKNIELIPQESLQNFPFNYKYLRIPKVSKNEKKLILKTGKLAPIQNENAQLETFYKNISRI
jgi:hypothetical protein